MHMCCCLLQHHGRKGLTRKAGAAQLDEEDYEAQAPRARHKVVLRDDFMPSEVGSRKVLRNNVIMCGHTVSRAQPLTQLCVHLSQDQIGTLGIVMIMLGAALLACIGGLFYLGGQVRGG